MKKHKDWRNNAKNVEISVETTYKWECPVCNTVNNDVVKTDPFKSIGYGDYKKECSNCGELIGVTPLLKSELK